MFFPTYMHSYISVQFSISYIMEHLLKCNRYFLSRERGDARVFFQATKQVRILNLLISTLEPGISLAVRCRLSSPQASYQEFSTTNCRSRVDSSCARTLTCACIFGRGHSCGLSIRSMVKEWSIGRSLRNEKDGF